MRFPRFRFTVRRMMVAVAIVAVEIGLVRLAIELRDLRDHGPQIRPGETLLAWVILNAFSLSCLAIAMALARVACRPLPWLPVAPDPPEPE